MRYITKVEAKYPLKERLQTLRKKPLDPKAKKALIAYDFPDGLWSKLIDSFTKVLADAGVKAQTTKTKSGHISIGLLQSPTEEELEKAKAFGSKNAPTFKIHGVEILGGLETPFGYVMLELDVPQRLRDYFLYLRKLVGNGRIQDYRTFSKDLKPHVSIVAIDPKDTEKARKALPELNAALKKIGVTQVTPKFVEVMLNFEIADWNEITGQLSLRL